MPVYEYRCNACGHEFEEWQKITDEAVKTCPKCSKRKVERLISMTAFQLKGGGWYKDLYSSSKNGESKKDTGGGESKATETKSEAKAESKPADAGGAKKDAGAKETKAKKAGSTPGK
jgi:putative FmdB family regulatory protein